MLSSTPCQYNDALSDEPSHFQTHLWAWSPHLKSNLWRWTATSCPPFRRPLSTSWPPKSRRESWRSLGRRPSWTSTPSYESGRTWFANSVNRALSGPTLSFLPFQLIKIIQQFVVLTYCTQIWKPFIDSKQWRIFYLIIKGKKTSLHIIWDFNPEPLNLHRLLNHMSSHHWQCYCDFKQDSHAWKTDLLSQI